MKELIHVRKLEDRSKVGVFIGYMERSKAYCILDQTNWCVRMVHDVISDEGCGWVWNSESDGKSTLSFGDFVIVCAHFMGAGRANIHSMSSPTHPPPTLTLRHSTLRHTALN